MQQLRSFNWLFAIGFLSIALPYRRVLFTFPSRYLYAIGNWGVRLRTRPTHGRINTRGDEGGPPFSRRSDPNSNTERSIAPRSRLKPIPIGRVGSTPHPLRCDVFAQSAFTRRYSRAADYPSYSYWDVSVRVVFQVQGARTSHFACLRFPNWISMDH